MDKFSVGDMIEVGPLLTALPDEDVIATVIEGGADEVRFELAYHGIHLGHARIVHENGEDIWELI